MKRLALLLASGGLVLAHSASGQDAALLTAPPTGQAATAYPAERGVSEENFPRIIRLSDGVYAYEDLRAPRFTTVSLFVVGSHGVLIADGQESPAATRRLLAAIAQVTPLQVRWYVVGSDHADHTGGNTALPADVRYIVHPTSLKQMRRDKAGAKHGTPPVILPKEAMRGTSEDIDLGGRSVRVLHLGPAHTGGDLVVQVPEAGILFMSEVFFSRVFPAMRSAYPSKWLAAVDAALRMNADMYVPGHGFVENGPRSRAELIEFRRALQHVITESQRLHALGLSPEAALERANWGPYGDWMLADEQRLTAIRQVYAEMDGNLGS